MKKAKQPTAAPQPQNRNLRTQNCKRWTRRLPTALCLLAGALVFSTAAARAATTFTWSNLSGGTWSTTGNWSGGLVGDGAGNFANFNTLNITANRTVTLDSARTIGTIQFGDTSGNSLWTLSGPGVLTMDNTGGGATPPLIRAVQDAFTVSVVLAGTAGIRSPFAGSPAAVLLNAANTYSGDTEISRSILRIGNVNALPAFTGNGRTGNVVFRVDNAQQGTLDLNNKNITINGLSSDVATAGLGTVTSGAAGAITLTLGDNNATTTFAGVIQNGSGTVSVTKIGNGTQTFSGANTYSGATTISAGTLTLSGANTGTGATTIGPSGTLALSGSGSTASSTINLGTGGTFDVSGATAPTIASGKTLNGSGGTGTINGSLTLASGALLTFTYAPGTPNFTVPSGTLTLSANATTVTVGSLINSGSYKLISQSGSGSVAGTTGPLTLAGAGIGDGGTPSLAITGGELYLNIVGGGPILEWGPADGTWAVGTAGWGSAGATTWADGDAAQLTDTYSTGSPTIALNTPVLPTGVLMSSTKTWTITGTGNIGGSAVVRMVGPGTLTMDAPNAYTGGTELTAGTLNLKQDSALGASGTFTINGGTLDNTKGSPMATPSYSQAWNGNFVFAGSSDLDLGTGAVTMSGTRTVTVNGSKLTVGGPISGSGFGLIKAGAGTLVLSGNNGFTGAVTISAGVLNIQNATATGTTAGGVSVTSGAALQIQGGIIVGAEALTLNGTGIASDGALRNISGNNTWGGAVTLGSATRINSDSGILTLDVASGNAIAGTFNLTFGGAGSITVADPIATSTGTVTEDGAGTLTLSGVNTYSGATTISAGTLALSGSGSLASSTINLSGSGTFDVSGVTATPYTIASGKTLNGSGGTGTINGGLTLASGALMTLTYAVGTPTMTVPSGTLTLNNNPITVNCSSFLVTGNYKLISVSGTGSVAGTPGPLTLVGPGIGDGGTPSLQIIGNELYVVVTGGGPILEWGPADGTWAVGTAGWGSGGLTTWADGDAAQLTDTYSTGSPTITLSTEVKPTALVMSSTKAWTITGGGDIGGSAVVRMLGPGTLTMDENNAYTGGTELTAGTLNLKQASALGASGTFTINGGTLDNTSGGLLTTPNYPQAWNGNFVFAGSSDLDLGTGPVTMSGTRTVTANGSKLTVGGAVSGSGFGLIKAGAGALALGGNNTFNGGLTINLGEVIVNNAGALNTATPNVVTFAADANTKTLSLNGNSLTVANLGGGATAGYTVTTVRNNHASTAATLQISVPSGSSTFIGTVADGSTAALAVTKIGSGTWVFGGGSSFSIGTYSGDTTISAGTLRVGGSNLLPNGAGKGNMIISGATLDMYDRNISINGLSGSGTVTAGANSIGNNLTLGGGDASGSFSGVIQNGSSISPFVNLTKNGLGTQRLSGVCTYTGPTTVNAGALVVNSPGSLASGSAVTVAANATLGGSGTISGTTTVSASGILAPGVDAAAAGTTLTLPGTVSLNATCIVSNRINKVGVTRTADKINKSAGTLTLAGTLKVVLDTGASALAPGDTFDLVDGTIAANTLSYNLPSLPAGLAWDTSQLNAGGNGTIKVVCDGSLSATAGVTGDGTIAVGKTNQLSGSASGGAAGYTYSWAPNTGLDSAAAQNPKAYPTTTTAYTLTVTDANGCTANAAPVTVTVVPLPTLNVSLIGSDAVVSWPAIPAYSPPQFQLYTNNDLLNISGWVLDGNAVNAVGGINYVTNSLIGTNIFFRLQDP